MLPVTGVDTSQVTAVMENVPSNAHIRPNVIASFAQREEKEVAIRKVLGATVASLVGRLVQRVLLPVGTGLVVAVPIAWAAGTQWLLQFASTSALPVAAFTVLLVEVLGLAAMITATKTVQGARLNPTTVLRAE